MGPILLIDKSALHSLSDQDMRIVGKFFTVMVTPMLLLEIVGDIEKARRSSTSERESIYAVTRGIATRLHRLFFNRYT